MEKKSQLSVNRTRNIVLLEDVDICLNSGYCGCLRKHRCIARSCVIMAYYNDVYGQVDSGEHCGHLGVVTRGHEREQS